MVVARIGNTITPGRQSTQRDHAIKGISIKSIEIGIVAFYSMGFRMVKTEIIQIS